MENECMYYEPDEFGDICHAEIGEECPNPFGCTAKYDIHGNRLVKGDEDYGE